MATMNWLYSGGYDPKEFATIIAIDDDYELADKEKDVFLAFSCEEASKTLTLGLSKGQFMIVANIGDTNAVTVANLEYDTGASIAVGIVALVIGSDAADETIIIPLNASEE